jgi:(2Fe-2S) ferredoxin
VCVGPTCGDVHGSKRIHQAFAEALASLGARARADLHTYCCFGQCTLGPNVLVQRLERAGDRPPARRTNALYNHVHSSDAAEIVRTHVLHDRIVDRLTDAPRDPAFAPASPNKSRG